jgi:hypothetical protein
MTTQNYIPTEEELENDMCDEYGGKMFYQMDDDYDGVLSYDCNNAKYPIEIKYHLSDNSWYIYRTGYLLEFYPKDKAHLQSIILAFKPK